METIGRIIDLGPSWHYQLESEIARSTFGVVLRAIWLQTGKPVAIKTVRRDRMQVAPPELRGLWPAGLRREIDCLGRIRHRHFVSALHHGEHKGLPVLVLAHLGGSLEGRLAAAGGRVPVPEALELVRQIAAGIADLHRYGLRHLDLKPGNLLLAAPSVAGQRLVIADFGTVLGLVPDEMAPLEHPFRGTRGWLAPEQVMPCRPGEMDDGRLPYRTDASTDVYGIGLLLFKLLTGHFTAFSAMAHRLLSRDPREAWQLRESLRTHADGLSADDLATLATAISGTTPIVTGYSASDPDNGTWVPEGGASGPTRRVVPELIAVLATGLERLLAGQPQYRCRNGTEALELIEGMQYACRQLR